MIVQQLSREECLATSAIVSGEFDLLFPFGDELFDCELFNVNNITPPLVSTSIAIMNTIFFIAVIITNLLQCNLM